MADFIRKKIVELPKQLADKIAAGEVVERVPILLPWKSKTAGSRISG